MTTIRGCLCGLATQTVLPASYESESPPVSQDSVNMREGGLRTGVAAGLGRHERSSDWTIDNCAARFYHSVQGKGTKGRE